jgi:hypothetical protein
MSFFNSSINLGRRSFNESSSAGAELLPYEVSQGFDFSVPLKELASLLAKTWKDEHPDAAAESEHDLNNCILAVTTELAIAAKAVGGPIGLEILTGGGSAAARAVCKQVLSGDRT